MSDHLDHVHVAQATPATVASALTSDKTHLPAGYMSRVSPKSRQRASERGEAMDDGSFPIRDGQDLKRAIAAFGRAKDKARAKRHIIKRARALDKIALLPESWQETAMRNFPAPQPEVASNADEDVLQKKADRHNAIAPQGRTVSTAKLKTIHRRGIRDFSTAPVDGITAEQAAQARVNTFLRELAAPSGRQFPDVDLLPGPPPFS